MLFNSSQFLIFFPIVVLIYFIFPKKAKLYWLLAASYYFYMCWNIKYILLILYVTAITYISGILLEKQKQQNALYRLNIKTKLIVMGSSILNLTLLFYFKYFNFGIGVIAKLLSYIHVSVNIPQFDIILPVGISFFTFQALGYTIDVYRGEIHAERNFFKYALFVSFFPQLVAGPIERSPNLIGQFSEPKVFHFNQARDGILLMLWGFFLKIVVADRIAIFVDTIYGNVNLYPGYYIVLATILFAFQIYCDFAGYSIIAMGSAKILGIRLTDNFESPYLAVSVAGFWRRWHISLTSWFRDYLYIPLGGNKKGTFRKHVNKMLVFLASGLWHGASISFVIWGGLNGLYQVISEIGQPLKNEFVKIFHIDRDSIGHKTICAIVTFILIDFTWIFFRAGSLDASLNILKALTVNNPWILFDGSLYDCGLDQKNYWLMIYGIILLMLVDLFKSRKIVIREIIAKQHLLLQWIVIDTAIIVLLVFGIWGSTYDVSNFIYFQF